MRILVFLLLLFSSLGVVYEIVRVMRPEWVFSPTVARLSELDPASRIGTFEFSESIEFAPLYLKVSDATEPTTDYDLLVVTEGADSVSYSVRSREEISISGKEFRIGVVRPWVGILSEPEGQPYISISIAPDGVEWAEDMLIGVGGEIVFNDFRFRLEVLNDNSVEEFVASHGGENEGRWGVEEGERVHWFDNLLPGAGVELDDGTVYTLLEFREEFESPAGMVPAIAVQVEYDGVKTRKIITTRTENAAVRLEYSSGHEIWFVATEDGSISVFGEAFGTRVVEIGDTWVLGSGEMMIRVEQYESTGIPVDGEQTSFQEAVLLGDSVRVRVRQGEAIRIGDALVRYQRVLNPVDTHYLLSLDDSMTDSEQIHFGDVREVLLGEKFYRIGYSGIDMSQSVSLVYTPEMNYMRLGIFVVLGAISLFLVTRLSSGRSIPYNCILKQ
jgi:hypothetical protein